MRHRQPSKLGPYVPLFTGIVTMLCAYVALYLIRNAMCDMTAIAIKTATECTYEFPAFVMNLPLVFFIAGGISTMVLLLWRRDHLD